MRAPVLPLAFLLACAGSDEGDPVDTDDTEAAPAGYIVGDPSGPIWDEIESELSLEPFDGQVDNGVWFASGGAASLDSAQIAAVNTLYQAGFPIVMIRPTQDDANALAAHIGNLQFPVEQDSTVEVLAYDSVDANGGNVSWHTWGYESDDQLARIADDVIEWYDEEEAQQAADRRSDYEPDDPGTVWPNEEKWPQHQIKGYNSTGIWVVLKQFVYPINDTGNPSGAPPRYLYPVVYHLSMEMQPSDSFPTAPVLTSVELIGVAPTFGTDAPCRDNPDNNCECIVKGHYDDNDPGALSCAEQLASNPSSYCTYAQIDLDDTQISPSTSLPSGKTTSSWSYSVGASCGMTMAGPTESLSVSATIGGAYTQNVAAVTVNDEADLIQGSKLHWILNYTGDVENESGLTETDTSMVFSGSYELPYDDSNNQGVCSWSLPYEPAPASAPYLGSPTTDGWRTLVRVGNPQGSGSAGWGQWQELWWQTPHPLNDQQVKDAIANGE